MIRDREIQLFSEGMNFAKEEFFLDAISKMEELQNDFPNSELIDDAIYNIGLCYFNMNQFEKAIKYFKKVIDEFPDGTISVLNGANEYGNTGAKCWYAIMNCNLAMGRVDNAKDALKELANYKDSHILQNDEKKITYEELAKNAFNLFENQTTK